MNRPGLPLSYYNIESTTPRFPLQVRISYLNLFEFTNFLLRYVVEYHLECWSPPDPGGQTEFDDCCMPALLLITRRVQGPICSRNRSKSSADLAQGVLVGDSCPSKKQ